jgi:integrase/recombinase XerD
MNESLPVPADSDQPIVPRQAETDAQLIELWLHGRSRHTQRGYRADILAFFKFAPKPLHQVMLVDIQTFADKLERDGLSPATRCRKLAAVKSLFSFGHKIGYLVFDVGKPVKVPAVRDTLNERILSEGEVQRMIALERHPRNHAIVFLLYAAGLRVSELCGLRWRDCCEREDGGQVTVFGKRGKTRTVLVPQSVWTSLDTLRDAAGEDAAVFRSRRGGHLDPSQIWRIVRRAAVRAGIEKQVSCHWLRHCHCSHALERGANVALVQQTVGHSSVATTGKYLHARPTDSSSKYLPI